MLTHVSNVISSWNVDELFRLVRSPSKNGLNLETIPRKLLLQSTIDVSVSGLLAVSCKYKLERGVFAGVKKRSIWGETQ